MICTYVKRYYTCDALDIDIYFELYNSIVFSIIEEESPSCDASAKKHSKIVALTRTEVAPYHSVSEASRYCRNEDLIIHGILSFFTGVPFTVYDSSHQEFSQEPISYTQQSTHLNIEGIEYTEDLIKTLKKIVADPELAATLLDRWRKAIFLTAESIDADLYYDEAILSFFHILELFAESTGKELKNTLENHIETMLTEHFAHYYFSSQQLNQSVNQNKKAVNSLLIGNSLTIAVKIKYFLQTSNLLDDKVEFFIDDIIKTRNAIAHGRISYKNQFIWPLSPFFNLAKNSYDQADILFFLTAVIISNYLEIERWKSEWETAHSYLLPPKIVFDKLLHDNIFIQSVTIESLSKGNKDNLTWRTIFNHYIKSPSKEVFKKLENNLSTNFLNTIVDEENAPSIFNISVLFADAEDSRIKAKAIENIKFIISKHWYGWSNFKDIISYLDFYNTNAEWYKKYLEDKLY